MTRLQKNIGVEMLKYYQMHIGCLVLLQYLSVEFESQHLQKIICRVYRLTAFGMCICCLCKLLIAALMAGAYFKTSEGKSAMLHGLSCQLPS